MNLNLKANQQNTYDAIVIGISGGWAAKEELTVLGFFTSEVGATEFLNFDEVPGGFQGCGSLKSLGGKTWAT